MGAPGDLFKPAREGVMEIAISFWRDFERAI
jgi:hypothetical protein